MANMTNGNGNGAEETAKVPTALDSSRERFESRKSPASEKEVLAAWKNYFKLDEGVQAAQKALEEAMAARTQATKELASLRGTSQQTITGKGVGRFMSRGDSAWVMFPSANAGPALTL